VLRSFQTQAQPFEPRQKCGVGEPSRKLLVRLKRLQLHIFEHSTLVQNKQCGRDIAFELGFERPLSLCGTQGIDHVDGVRKQDTVALLTSRQRMKVTRWRYPMKKFNVGVLGIGDISDVYIKNLKKYNIVNVVACAGRNLQKAQEKAAAHAIAKAYATPAELVADANVDIVLNLTCLPCMPS
jgi:hypothetical protein